METTQPLKYTLVAITTALLMLSMTVFAAPFIPGQTLDPGCNPGDVDCYVNASDTDWTTDANGVWNTSDNIGIGTSNPQKSLDIEGQMQVYAGNYVFGAGVGISALSPGLTGISLEDVAGGRGIVIGENGGNPVMGLYNQDSSQIFFNDNRIQAHVGDNLDHDNTDATLSTVGGFGVEGAFESVIFDSTHTHKLTNGENNFSVDLPEISLLFTGGADATQVTGDVEVAGATKQIGTQKVVIGVLDFEDLLLFGGVDSVMAGTLWLDESTDEILANTIDEDGFSLASIAPLDSKISGFDFNEDTIRGTVSDFNGGSAGFYLTVDGFGLGDSNGINYTFPISDGTTGQVLTTDGAGVVTWGTVSGGGSSYELYDENPVSPAANTVTGDNSVAIGSGAFSSGSSSVALGGFARATGNYSFATGNHSSGRGALGELSFATGDKTIALGGTSAAFGYATESRGSKSASFGDGSIAVTFGEFSSGLYNTIYTPFDISAGLSDSTVSAHSVDRLFTLGNGESGSRSDAFTILKSAQTGINIDNFEANTTGEFFQVNNDVDGGDIARFTNTSGFCTIDHTGFSFCTSDERLKKDITELRSSLEIVDALNPVTYRWKNEEGNKAKTYGFLSQEVAQVFPDATRYDAQTDTYGLNYGSFIPLAISAIKELDQKFQESEIIYALKEEDKNMLTTLLENTMKKFDELFANTITAVSGIFENIEAKNVTTDELCMGDLCITPEQFQSVFGTIAVKKQEVVSSVTSQKETEKNTDTASVDTQATESMMASDKAGITEDQVVPGEAETSDETSTQEEVATEQPTEESIVEAPQETQETTTSEVSQSEGSSIKEIIARIFSKNKPKVLAKV